jgi:hypothetical protein
MARAADNDPMKSLLKIVLVGTAGFLILAIAQEWSFFSEAWFGSVSERDTLSPEERKEAADTVYQTLALTEHFYASGGDPRFAERMPASDAFVEEMRIDIQYLGRNHRIQEPSLERLDVIAVEGLDGGGVQIYTRELWKIQYRWAKDGSSIDTPDTQSIERKYLLRRGTRGWLVEGWDLADPEL